MPLARSLAGSGSTRGALTARAHTHLFDMSEHDSNGEDSQQQPIEVPDNVTALGKLALRKCLLFACRGSSFQVECQICGWEGTSSAHKLIYGHYLRQGGNEITFCVALSKLQSDHTEFFLELKAKGDALEKKRRRLLLPDCRAECVVWS
jgi:hypothetical protein